jgi:hypothetical protein
VLSTRRIFIHLIFLRMVHPQHQRQLSRHWYLTRDGDPKALNLYERHYSCRKYRDSRKRRLFVGPGEKLVLITKRRDALFVWRKFIDRSGQTGVNCAVFRNEGPAKSSRLIWEAMEIAWRRWPGERLYTYVNPKCIRSTNPGYCFKQVGWKLCGTTKRAKLTILVAVPSAIRLGAGDLG